MRLLALALLVAAISAAAQSKSAFFGPDGKLVYGRTPKGDHIADFSYAGYRGGGVGIPVWPATVTVSPAGGDDTAAIQAAIDKVSSLPLDSSGHRGVVHLTAGRFHCAKTLTIKASGVVLQGASEQSSTIELTGAPHLGISVAGDFHESVLPGATTLTAEYLPSGTRLIHVADASAIHVGDTLLLIKPASPAWVKFMGMDKLERSDRAEHWVGEDLQVRRHVVAVKDNTVMLDVPLTDNIDPQFLGGMLPPVKRIEDTGLIAEDGVEDLSIAAPSRAIAYQEDAEFDGIRFDNAVDAWIRSVHLDSTTNSIMLGKGVARATVKLVSVHQSNSVTSSAKNFEFYCNGTQILFDRISGNGDSVMFFATQARQQGPVVVLHSRFLGTGRIEPHQRWSTGLLVDSCELPQGGISLINRGIMGSGHGWTIGWAVSWNNIASSIMVQMPPGAINWSIGDRGMQDSRAMPDGNGSHGPTLPHGFIESPNKPVEPASLYLAQLKERLGESALKAIGYGDASH